MFIPLCFIGLMGLAIYRQSVAPTQVGLNLSGLSVGVVGLLLSVVF